LHSGHEKQPLDCQPMYVRDKVAQTTSERLVLKHGSV
jgi:tRNA threonylcarbamoyladenosine biosynthesis protein TsaB